jgi:hypothetical protein
MTPNPKVKELRIANPDPMAKKAAAAVLFDRFVRIL